MRPLRAHNVEPARMLDAARYCAKSVPLVRSTAIKTQQHHALHAWRVSTGRQPLRAMPVAAYSAQLARQTWTQTARLSATTAASENMARLGLQSARAARARASSMMTVIPRHLAQTQISVYRDVQRALRTTTVMMPPTVHRVTLAHTLLAGCSQSLDVSPVLLGRQTVIPIHRHHAISARLGFTPRRGRSATASTVQVVALHR